MKTKQKRISAEIERNSRCQDLLFSSHNKYNTNSIIFIFIIIIHYFKSFISTYIN